MTTREADFDLLARLGREVAAGSLIPYLGPAVLSLNPEPGVPLGARELARFFAARVGVPGRIRDNLWHASQYIESHRHRVTLDRLMAQAFATTPEPTALHRWLAAQPGITLIIDTWYDGAMRRALEEAGRLNWGAIHAVSRARGFSDEFVRAMDSQSAVVPEEAAAAWTTLLYKPHGMVGRDAPLLLSDADYVEVLTEIDIQTPIPAEVRSRREPRGFLFLGCRFYDQILRTFARQIIKRSQGPHWAVVPEDLTRNERRFLTEQNIVPITMDLEQAVSALTRPSPPAAAPNREAPEPVGGSVG